MGAAEDVAVGKSRQLATKIVAQPLCNWRAKADAIRPRYDRLRQIVFSDQAQDALARSGTDLVVIRQSEGELDDPPVDIGNARLNRMRHGVAVGDGQYRPKIAGQHV